jgi:hypothetical protein
MPRPTLPSLAKMKIIGLGETTYHEEGRDDPVDENAERNLDPDLPILKYLVQRFVSHFTENGIHHDQQSNCFATRSARFNGTRPDCVEDCSHTNRN